MDHVYRVQAVPAPGTEARVHGASLTPGGGFNAMIAARRMGMTVSYGGTLGTGAFADRISHALAEAGIEILRPPLPGLDQGCCTVLIDDDGERSFIASEGADGRVTDHDLAGLELWPGNGILLSGYALLYPGSGPALTRWLGARPRQLVFDPGPQIAAVSAGSVAAAAGHSALGQRQPD